LKKRLEKHPGKYASNLRQDKPQGRSALFRRRISPAELFLISFLGLIIFGTLGLKFLPGIYQGEPLGWSDCVFTATSAVCVTGLIVVDTATYFTLFGQAFILLLIQLGGLGMLVLASVVIIALGGRPSMRTESLAIGSRALIPHIPAGKLISDIVRFTFIFEGIGAVMLFSTWAPRVGWKEALWPSFFHSISAYCNAGFSTYTDSLMGFQNSPATLFIISAMILLGGLGFVTIEELHLMAFRNPTYTRRLSVHSKLVLVTTTLLTIVPMFMFASFEWNGLLSELPLSDKLTNSFFLSVTPRTAGFNSIDYALASDSTNFLTIILMMIGGSPGSTAGGMKTTTFALLGLLAWSRLRSQPTATFANRSIPEDTIQRATGLFVIATGIVVVGVFIMAAIDNFLGTHPEFLAMLFEIVSALNTVGLSMGLTPGLTTPARWLIIILMFIGRTGPLAIAAALVVRLSRSGKFRLAYEDVLVG
jgi:trk system potassium uptake protein